MHENDAEKALVAIQEESEVRGAAAERFEHMVAMALEAWESCNPRPMRGEYWSDCRADFERAVRERLAQSATVLKEPS